MKCRLIIFFLFTIIQSLPASPEEGIDTESWIAKIIDDSEIDTPLIDSAAAPSSIVGGVVNAITGNYFETECDLVIPGTNPLIVQRHFTSGGPKARESNEWYFNLPGEIEIFENDKARFALLKEQGANFLFEGSLKEDIVTMKLIKKIFRYGVTNCSSGRLSSRHNLKNRRLFVKNKSKHCRLLTESGQMLKYNLHHDKYFPEKALFPNGCYLKYARTKDDISQVASFGADDTFFSDISFLYSKDDSKILSVKSSDGRQVLYNYKNGRIKSAIRENGPNIEYQYKREQLKKSLPNDRYLEVQYYKQGDNCLGQETVFIKSAHDSRIGRVSALCAPVGVDASPVLIWKFKYRLNEDKQTSKPIGGKTEVFDALGHRKIYSFSDEQRLTSVRCYLDNGQLYRTEKMEWGPTGNLIARGLADSSGKLQCCRIYRYDSDDNATNEFFFGNLSGWCEETPCMSGRPTGERFFKTYTYTSNGLTESEDDGRRKIVYKYYGTTDLVQLKLVLDKEIIRERYYFAYDSKGALIYESIDDGNSPDISNLSGATERRIKRIYPTTTQPIGLPKRIEERFLNRSTGEEELLIRKENKFTKEGWLSCQRVYDKNGKYCYSIERSYDAWGHVLKEIDPLGQITSYQYDQNGNLTFKQTPNLNFHTLYTYDHSNRLIKEEEVCDGNHLIKTYSYDYNGNRITATDIFGNTTKYRYDEFNRLLQKINPPILGKFGLYEPIDKVAYDIFNNPTEKTDSNKFMTKIKYTHWGKPYDVCYPDGSMEKSRYHLDGTLETVVDVNGTATSFSYDYNSRKTREEKFSPEGTLLSTQTWIYNAFHLLAEIDTMGHKKSYFYDHAGRLVSTKKGSVEVKYVYDSLNRQSEVWELYEPGKYRKTIAELDNLNRVIQQRIEDDLGNILSCHSYAYDCDGNKILEAVHTSQGNSCIRTQYNIHKKPIKITLTGELAKVIKPDGVSLVHSYDHLGRLVDLHSSDGSIHYVFTRDLNDNIIKIEDCVHHNTTQRVFDRNDRLILENLANGLQVEYQYDLFGRLKGLALPDQTTVSYLYDAFRLKTITRSKGGNSLSQHYIHDLSGRLSRVDLPSLGSIVYTYDACLRPKQIESPYWLQQISYDPCGNVLTIHQKDVAGEETSYFSYDALYHLINETGFANSYTFDSLQNRISKNNDQYHVNALNQLKHELGNDYDHDPNGNLSKRRCSTGEILYQYDALDRLIVIQSPDKKVEYLYDALHRRLKKTILQEEEKETILYAYQEDMEIGAYDLNNPLETRVLGVGNRGDIGAAAFTELQGQPFVPLYDYRGNIVVLLDIDNKTIREYYRYTAYGEEHIFDGSGTALPKSINPWRFSSKRIDPETGWSYFGRRYYDAKVGRWTTPDPLGFDDGFNLYCFVRNRPLLFIDPNGRSICEFFGRHYEELANSFISS